MPVDAYKAMKETIESPDESVPIDNVLNVAMLLFMNQVYAKKSEAETWGRGDSTQSKWGKDDDGDGSERGRRCA